MYRHTDTQMPLFPFATKLPSGVVRRLEQSWAPVFAREIFPVLLGVENRFARLYDRETGRPNFSVARLLALMFLQELQSLTDEEVLEALSFDLRYQHALSIEPDQAYISRRSYVAFRRRMVTKDPELCLLDAVFRSVGQHLVAALGLSTAEQRLDSTLVVSNIRTKGRRDLFGKTLRHFLQHLSKTWPAKMELLSGELRAWFEDSKQDVAWFGMRKGDDKALLQQRAEWLVEVMHAFAADQEIAGDERYQLVVRVVREHCTVVERDAGVDGGSPGVQEAPVERDAAVDGEAPGVQEAPVERDAGDDGEAPGVQEAPVERDAGDDAEPLGVQEASVERDAGVDDEAPDVQEVPVERDAGVDGEGPDVQDGPVVTVRPRPEPAGASLQSPYDPDAAYGHKGCGYFVHATETCNNGELPEIITDFAVVPANEHDSTQTMPTIERLAEQGMQPKTLYADSGYTNPALKEQAETAGTRLHAPIEAARLPDDHIGRDAFTFDEQSGHVTTCPQGHAPIRHAVRSTTNEREPTLHAYFDGATCRACPLLGRCAVRGPNNGKSGSFHLELLPRLRTRDQALVEQRTEQWKSEYKIRSGVEATMSELKNTHSIGRLPVRRLVRVRLKVIAKLTACNVRRYMRWAMSVASVTPPTDDQRDRTKPQNRQSRVYRSLSGAMSLLFQAIRRLRTSWGSGSREARVAA
jgi:hypothetical protein